MILRVLVSLLSVLMDVVYCCCLSELIYVWLMLVKFVSVFCDRLWCFFNECMLFVRVSCEDMFLIRFGC